MASRILQSYYIFLQLLYQLGLLVLCNYLIIIPLFAWRYVIRPLDNHFYWFLNVTVISFILQVFLNRFESHALQFITLVVLKRMPLIIDDFMARFLACANVVISFLLCLVNTYDTASYNNELRYTGLPTFLAQDRLPLK